MLAPHQTCLSRSTRSNSSTPRRNSFDSTAANPSTIPFPGARPYAYRRSGALLPHSSLPQRVPPPPRQIAMATSQSSANRLRRWKSPERPRFSLAQPPPHHRTWISFSGSITPPCSVRLTASRATRATLKTSCKPSSCACCAANRTPMPAHGRLSTACSRKRSAGPDPLPAGRAANPPRRGPPASRKCLPRSRSSAPVHRNPPPGCDKPSRRSIPGPPKCSRCASLKAVTIRKSPALGTTPASVAVTLSARAIAFRILASTSRTALTSSGVAAGNSGTPG